MTEDGSVSEVDIKSAIQKRAEYLVDNLACVPLPTPEARRRQKSSAYHVLSSESCKRRFRRTCTMKQCRRLLEEDLALPAKALDGYKDVVADEVDRVRLPPELSRRHPCT